MSIFLGCSNENKLTCSKKDTSNMCVPINEVDTCTCGTNLECDPNGTAPKCRDIFHNDVTSQDDIRAMCKSGKHFAYM